MIKHLKINIALFICTAFIFRIVFVNVVMASSLNAPQNTSHFSRKNHFDALNPLKNYPLQADAIVESTEDSSNILLVKDPECPSALIAIFHCFKSLPNATSLRNLAEHSYIKQSNRTYLSISVLRI